VGFKSYSFQRDLFEYRQETIELLFERVLRAFDLKECPRQRRSQKRSVWVGIGLGISKVSAQRLSQKKEFG